MGGKLDVQLASGEWVAIGLFVTGTVFTVIANYLKFMNEFNYIKGQLSQILEIHEGFTEIAEKHAKMESDLHKTLKDLDKAFLRIKLIESKFMGMHQ